MVGNHNSSFPAFYLSKICNKRYFILIPYFIYYQQDITLELVNQFCSQLHSTLSWLFSALFLITNNGYFGRVKQLQPIKIQKSIFSYSYCDLHFSKPTALPTFDKGAHCTCNLSSSYELWVFILKATNKRKIVP